MIKYKNTFIKNIYYMLSYAFTVLDQDDYKDVAKEEFENIHNLFSAILSKGISRQLKQGLYREYINHEEEIPTLKGKINIQETIKNSIARKRILACEYDDLSENNLYNKIIKTTVVLLLRSSEVDEIYKSELKKEILYFSNVDIIDPTSIHWTSIRFHRNNNTYRMLLGICQLVLEGMLLTTDSGQYHLASFVDEQKMNRLYEKFILEYYIKECPQVKTTASRISWALDDEENTFLPIMQSDITLEYGDKVLIIDAKYYANILLGRFDRKIVSSDNIYQIFTYVKNKQIEVGNNKKVSGMLLYAKTDEEIFPDVTYKMSGNDISVKTLDLNKEFSEIKNQLNAIVDEYFEC